MVRSEELDILFMSETKRSDDDFWKGPRIPGYAWQELNRTAGQKNGGGLAVMYKEDRTIATWEGLPSDEEISRERMWITYNSGTEKYGFIHAYLACETSRRQEFYENNVQLLSIITSEIEYLRSLDFKIVLCGDLNAWTGVTGVHGMIGNRTTVNQNGQLLIDFMDSHSMKIANKLECADGKFTRFPPEGFAGGKSILDLFVIDDVLEHQIKSVWVDEDNQYQLKSDHRLVTMVLEHIDEQPVFIWRPWKPKFKIDPERMPTYAELLEAELCPFGLYMEMSPEDMYVQLLAAIDKVGMDLFKIGGLQRRRMEINSGVRELRKQQRNMKKEGKHLGMKYISLSRKIEKKIANIRAQKTSEKFSVSENLARKKLLLNPNVTDFWKYVQFGKRGDVAITLAQDQHGVTVATKKEVKKAFYEEFRQRFEASRKKGKTKPKEKSDPGENYIDYISCFYPEVFV